ETFILAAEPGYEPYHPSFGYLFNSYYEAVGPRHPRPARGLLTRPSVADVYRYRQEIDERISEFLDRATADALARAEPVLILGLHREQQHQELLLTDLKYAFSCNPLLPAYQDRLSDGGAAVPPQTWHEYAAGLREIGHDGDGFAFDNESPRHPVWVGAF